IAIPVFAVGMVGASFVFSGVRVLESERRQLQDLVSVARAQTGAGSQPEQRVAERVPIEELPTRLVADGGTASAASAESKPSAASAPGASGQALARDVRFGRYTVQRSLGQGGMGAIFLALDNDLQRQVAIKVLNDPDRSSFDRFRREALAVARIVHPNVVQIHEVGLDARAPYIVMEF